MQYHAQDRRDTLAQDQVTIKVKRNCTLTLHLQSSLLRVMLAGSHNTSVADLQITGDQVVSGHWGSQGLLETDKEQETKPREIREMHDAETCWCVVIRELLVIVL